MEIDKKDTDIIENFNKKIRSFYNMIEDIHREGVTYRRKNYTLIKCLGLFYNKDVVGSPYAINKSFTEPVLLNVSPIENTLSICFEDIYCDYNQKNINDCNEISLKGNNFNIVIEFKNLNYGTGIKVNSFNYDVTKEECFMIIEKFNKALNDSHKFYIDLKILLKYKLFPELVEEFFDKYKDEENILWLLLMFLHKNKQENMLSLMNNQGLNINVEKPINLINKMENAQQQIKNKFIPISKKDILGLKKELDNDSNLFSIVNKFVLNNKLKEDLKVPKEREIISKI